MGHWCLLQGGQRMEMSRLQGRSPERTKPRGAELAREEAGGTYHLCSEPATSAACLAAPVATFGTSKTKQPVALDICPLFSDKLIPPIKGGEG